MNTASIRLGRVMGCRATLSVTAAAGRADRLIAEGCARLRDLERCWSRFLPDSDISRLGRAAGRPLTVDPATITLITAMAAAARDTGGAFDPTLLMAVVGLGYGPCWSSPSRSGAGVLHHDRLAWIDRTLVDTDRATVTLAEGVHLDPGAIGKGLAADLVAELLVERGAAAATVVVGGDVRVTAPSVVAVHGPDRRPIDRIGLGCGGVATSGTSRCWTTPDGRRAHHVIEPASGRPLERSAADAVVQVTVAAATAAHAEVHATAVLVDPAEGRIRSLGDRGVGVLAVDRRGVATANEPWNRMRQAADTAGSRA